MEDEVKSKVKHWLKELPKEFIDESSSYLADETAQSQEQYPELENWDPMGYDYQASGKRFTTRLSKLAHLPL